MIYKCGKPPSAPDLGIPAAMPMIRVMAILLCFGAAACADGSENPTAAPSAPLTTRSVEKNNANDCVPELYAYTSVLTLAKRLGSAGDVYRDALDDLKDQLVDCLTDAPADLVPVRKGRTSPTL